MFKEVKRKSERNACALSACRVRGVRCVMLSVVVQADVLGKGKIGFPEFMSLMARKLNQVSHTHTHTHALMQA